MLKRQVNWALTTTVVCAGLWCCLSPRTTDAAGGGKAVQISVVGTDGKPLSGAQVEFLRPGGKTFEAVPVSKDSWMLKDAVGKVTVSVRDGRAGGTIELVLPDNASDLVSYVVTLSGSELRSVLVAGDEAPAAPAKPEINAGQLQRSTRASFNDANRPGGLQRGPAATTTNSTVKSSAYLVPPANDNCASASPVGSLPATVFGTNVEATDDAGSPSCGVASGPFKNIWYTVVGTGNQITVSACNPGTDNGGAPPNGFDTKISVFCNDCVTKVCVGGNDDTAGGCAEGAYQSTFTFCSEAGRTYLVTVGGFSATTPTGAIQLDFTEGASCNNPVSCIPPQPPANDLCDNAIAMGPFPDSELGNNALATNDTLAACGTAPQNKTIWYSLIGDGNTLTATTCSAATTVSDTELVVYCSDCAAPLCIGGNDDATCSSGGFKSTFSWCSEAGATYLIAAGTYQGSTASGNIQVSVTSSGTSCSGAIACLAPPTGACCSAGVCTGTVEQGDCASPATWHVGESCPAFACPGPSGCAGETCASAAPISALPFVDTGNSCDCANDYDAVCPYTGSLSQDAVYSYTPSVDTCVNISLCNGSDYDTKVYVMGGDCSTIVACNDDSCTSPNFPSAYVSNLEGVVLTGGTTYYIVVDGYAGACGNYVLDVTQVPCPVPCADCPVGGVAENEPDCGLPVDTVNGGCNSTPPIFSPLACGQDVCGTAAWDGATRDTDWYQVTFAVETTFTWTVTADFDAVIGMVETSPLGTPDCATATALNPFRADVACDTMCVTSTVPAGTYWFLVLPDFNGPSFACGAQYTARLECGAVSCPSTCVGDTCETAVVIPSTPFADTGNTCDCSDNYDEICPFDTPGSSDLVYSYTPSVDECVDISMCLNSAYDSKLYVYQGTCGTFQSGTAIACNDDECATPSFGAPYVSEVTGVNLTAGQTYYIVVDGYAGACGDYTLDIGPCAPPCDVVCSATAAPEGEPDCGLPEDTVNGGCNNAVPIFTPLTCGGSICGTTQFDGATRDTDWFEVTVAGSTLFTWTATSEFLSLTGPVPTSPAGTGNCADLLGVVEPALFGEECTPGTVVTECLPAGTYWFFMAPTFDDTLACGKEYEVGLSCTPCVIPLGACCRPDGSCDDGIAEAACENWQGDGTTCANVVCPQPPDNDLCDDAITVAIPSVTAGDTSLATFDTGLPATCGTSITTAGVWYQVIGNGNTLTVDTCNGSTLYDSKISVFCPNCAAPACVGGNDDFCGLQTSVSWCSASGETYLILVHGFGGQTGPFELTVSDGPACSTPASCEVVGICGGGGDCCSEGSVPGCNDVDCCETVCACDPFCCDVVWDINCAGPNAFVPGCSCLEACDGGGDPTGACCVGAGCSITTQADCGGTYLGDGTVCNGPDVPANSYTDNPGAPIPDGPAGTVSDTLEVPDSFTIGDLNVDLTIPHTWVGDLVVTITHGSTSVTIVDQPGVPALGTFGCDQDNYSNILLDDEGTGGPIEDACQADLTSPPNYIPNNPLSAFDGDDAMGTWTITVTDSAGFDTGSLEGWSLHFGTPGPSNCIPSGACCLSPTQCVVTEPSACNGIYLGDGTNCSAAGPVTVYSADPGVAIPDAPASPPGAVGAPVSHTITVPDSYTLADVDIDLVISHTWVGDLTVSVEHNSTTVMVVDRPGFAGTGFGCGSDNYDIILDDQGTGGTVEALCGTTTTPTSPPNYTPNNPLSVFAGMNSSGNWTITVIDNANLDTGSLVHWSLHLTQPGSGPCSGVSFCGNGTVEDGEECDGGACCDADCTYASAGTICNPSAGDCDVAESCSGSSAACPPNGFSSGNVCRPSTGPCDPAESCSGTGPICPPNTIIFSCVNGDGCCPSGCNNNTDNDCPAICGNDVTEAGEECDGISADACEAGCEPDCTCTVTDIPTMSEWGLAVMALLLLIGAKLYFGRREVTA